MEFKDNFLVDDYDWDKHDYSYVNDNNKHVQNDVISFISKLESYKTKCKNLHWSADNEMIHTRLDEYLNIISDFEDSIAEEIMGITGKFKPDAINTENTDEIIDITEPGEFISAILSDTQNFYNMLSELDNKFAGLRSETESFIHNTNKYKYLFSLCN